MTAQRILTASLDWKLVMTKAGIRFRPDTLRLLNSLTQYLGACAEIDERRECDQPACAPGAPYQTELVAEQEESR